MWYNIFVYVLSPQAIIVLALLITPFLTACGSSNKLLCEVKNGESKIEVEIDFESKKENITGASESYTMDLSGIEDFSDMAGCNDLSSCLKKWKEELKEGCEEESYNESCKIVSETKTGFTIKATLKTEDVFKEFENKSYEEIKKVLEEEGYTCK